MRPNEFPILFTASVFCKFIHAVLHNPISLTLCQFHSRLDLQDVDVEVKEGRHAEYAMDKIHNTEQPLIDPKSYPLVGASIAISRNHTDIINGVGTLGGYIRVDGKIYALTNHHVIFGGKLGSRLHAFPTDEESSSKLEIVVNQPAEYDLEKTIRTVEADLEDFKDYTQLGTNVADFTAKEQEAETRLKKLKAWQTKERIKLGKVFKTSGIRVVDDEQVPRRHRLDWALVEIANPGRFTEFYSSKLVNEVKIFNTLGSYFTNTI